MTAFKDSISSGAWAEIIACGWLMELGYHVFRNLSPKGPIDVVGVKFGNNMITKIHFFDVKLMSVERNSDNQRISIKGGFSLTPAQVSVGVRQIYITRDGVCAFSKAELRAKYGDKLELDKRRDKRVG